MNTLFISDLHLTQNSRTRNALFLHFLKHYTTHAAALYILGDLFEAWIGDDHMTAFNQTIQQALARAAQHCPIYFMHGNRDGLIRETFARAANIQILPDPTCITLYGEKIVLMHGDALCTDDHAYQRARLLFTDHEYQNSLLCKPLWMRKLYAHYLRYKSDRHKRRVTSTIMDVNADAVQHTFQHYAVNYLIHGHTHRPGMHLTLTDGQYQQRIVLSDWVDRGNVLICSPQGEKQLVYFTETSTAPGYVGTPL